MSTYIAYDRPVYRRVAYNLKGLSWIDQIKTVWRNPPRFELLQDWIIIFPDGTKVIVPTGFITDGASIPRWLWWLISPFGPLLEGALLHDFGYQYGYLLTEWKANTEYSAASKALYSEYRTVFKDRVPIYIRRPQKFFDVVIRDVTIALNGATVHGWLAYVALSWFGDIAWFRYREHGPGVYTPNSLELPGVDTTGSAL